MLNEYPIMFNNEEVKAWNTTWDESYSNINTVNLTEAGTDDVEISRFGKVTIGASFQCSNVWAQFFRRYSEMAYFSVKYYDTLTGAYVTKTVRMEEISISLQILSKDTPGTTGLYLVTFTLYEF